MNAAFPWASDRPIMLTHAPVDNREWFPPYFKAPSNPLP